jgi:hypothetical protein
VGAALGQAKLARGLSARGSRPNDESHLGRKREQRLHHQEATGARGRRTLKRIGVALEVAEVREADRLTDGGAEGGDVETGKNRVLAVAGAPSVWRCLTDAKVRVGYRRQAAGGWPRTAPGWTSSGKPERAIIRRSCNSRRRDRTRPSATSSATWKRSRWPSRAFVRPIAAILNGHVYSEADRALIGTLAGMTSLALSCTRSESGPLDDR